uniref:WD repeat-containing protein 37 n=1 Tax=Strigamia maritima TaxID=126957 RepID=T1J3Q0_STRMM
MPQDTPFSNKPIKSKRISIPRVRSSTDSDLQQPFHFVRDIESDSVLPTRFKNRLHELFNQIEKEFETLYTENMSLHEKVDSLNERLEKEISSSNLDNRSTDLDVESGKSIKKSSQTTHLIKTTHKLKAQTSKIVSSFKAPTLGSHLIREYTGHRDGVWEISVPRAGQNMIGTASADHTARIWSIDTGKCLLEYVGHHGSVNSIRFHPTQDLVITASGDQSAHIWCFISALDSGKSHSSEDEVELSEKEETHDDEVVSGERIKIHSPLYELIGHTGVVIAADWVAGGDHVITASWDRCASLYDARTGQVVHSVVGHEQGLTNVVAHPSQRLVVTSSKDSTFRIWDLREASQAALVCHGHADAVTTATFTANDKVVSGSDDRCVKIWDTKNLRSPLATIRSDASANRLSVSNQQVLAVPMDNRHVRLYDINGNRLARLPRGSRQGHRRMVCAAAWLDESPAYVRTNLFTCGFDRLVLGWQIHALNKEGKESVSPMQQ